MAKVLCEVESYPPPEGFRWTFNNSAESREVPHTRFSFGHHNFSSVLSYTPVGEFDYGTVMCTANNLAGLQVGLSFLHIFIVYACFFRLQQAEPCVFHIIAAGKPDPPTNCTISNQTSQSLVVECIEGFDGGQPQFFLLEVYDQQTGALQNNLSVIFPLFNVNDLEPGKILKMMVYAANSKGRSEAVLLEGFTLKAAEKQTGKFRIFDRS